MASNSCIPFTRLASNVLMRNGTRNLCMADRVVSLVHTSQTRGKATQIPAASKSGASSSTTSQKKRPKDFEPYVQHLYDKMFGVHGPIPESLPNIRGYDFNDGVDYEKIFQTYENIGHQATFLGRAVKVLNGMIDCKLSPIDPQEAPTDRAELIAGRPKTNCTIFLGYTSNMISSGTRELLRYLVEHNMVDCIVSTAGGVEEDIMKCIGPFRLCEFRMDDKDLARNNLPRNANIMVPGGLYAALDDFLMPIVDDMVHEQKHHGVNWTPSDLTRELGKHVNHEDSLLYWAYKNNIPVFCPALTDGGIGDSLFFHSYRYGKDNLRLDIVHDLRKLGDMVIHSVNTGGFNIGAGITKHHILNTNSYRLGLDFSVYVNTALEYDGSDAGAPPDEAVSWMKIKPEPKMEPVKVATEASIALPIMIAGSFAKRQAEFEEFYKSQ